MKALINNKKHSIEKIKENSLILKFLLNKLILINSIFKFGSRSIVKNIINIWIANFILAEIGFLSSNSPKKKKATIPNIKEKYILL